MLKSISMMIATACMATSTNAIAAMPSSIKYIEDVVLDNNNSYSHYIVKCSDGHTADISAWNRRQKWCIGKGDQKICTLKQTQIAKAVCITS